MAATPTSGVWWIRSVHQQDCNRKIKKQVLGGESEQAILTYIAMQDMGFYADNFTFPVILKASGNLASSSIGTALHAQTVKTGFSDHVFVQTALLNMYKSLQCIDDACKMFESISLKDIVVWNSMLDAYASCGHMEDARKLFDSMPCKDVTSFNIMISGYANLGDVTSARTMFDEMNFRDIVSWNSLISAHANAKDMNGAQKLFATMPAKNVVTWNTMVTGYLHSQLYSKAIGLLGEMKSGKVKPDHLTVAGVISACSHLGTLATGTELHRYAQYHGFSSSSHVTSSLVDMYAKCGSIQISLAVFYKSPVKDNYCWNAIISGLALHGYGYAALDLFHEMTCNCVRPDDITFIGLLSACSHSGLVKEGLELFESMEKDFGIARKMEHYGCIVDLLGRGGFLERARQLVQEMPFKPGESILGALLSACVIHQDLETAHEVVNLMTAEAHAISDGEFVMMANLYASCGRWEDSDKWRDTMNNAGIVKTAGWSSIEIDGEVYKFLAGDMRTN